MKKPIAINRDPFARSTLMRVCHPDHFPCRWCGQEGKYDYYWEDDSLHPPTYRDEHRRYCSIGCYRAYTT